MEEKGAVRNPYAGRAVVAGKAVEPPWEVESSWGGKSLSAKLGHMVDHCNLLWTRHAELIASARVEEREWKNWGGAVKALEKRLLNGESSQLTEWIRAHREEERAFAGMSELYSAAHRALDAWHEQQRECFEAFDAEYLRLHERRKL